MQQKITKTLNHAIEVIKSDQLIINREINIGKDESK